MSYCAEHNLNIFDDRGCIECLRAKLAEMTAKRDSLFEQATELGRKLAAAEEERDALAAAMPAEQADVALAYAAMRTERDTALAELESAKKASATAVENWATDRAEATRLREALIEVSNDAGKYSLEPHVQRAVWAALEER